MSAADPDATLFEQAACGLARTTVDGRFLRVNATFAAWLGRDVEHLVGRRRLQDFFTMGGRIFHQTHWVPLLEMQRSVSEVKLELVRADGEKIPIVFNAIRRERDGEIIDDVAAFVARDRDMYERELLRSRRRLEELVTEARRVQEGESARAVFAERMVGIVSHDLRNPLSTITMACELLAKSAPTERQARTIGMIQRGVNRATALVTNLLDLTQAQAGGGISVARKEIDLREFFASTMEELTFTHGARLLEWTCVGDGACFADPDRLAQVIGNLVSNAMTYGAPDHPVSVRADVEPGHFAIAVSNHGPPIPAEVQTSIFEPMKRGTNENDRRRSVGLGLYIVAEIARAHGGTATVTSDATVGTTFTVTLPRRETDT